MNRLIYLIVLSVVLSGDADHLIFNRICINPDESELIEIYNPTDETINLSNYYLSDQNDYYNWVIDNSSFPSLNSRDFLIKFPATYQIESKESLIITTLSDEDFFNYYDELPDISLIDTEFEVSEIGSSVGLDNNQEMLILFYWDGISQIIQDVDYFLWGSTLRGFSKTTGEGYAYNDTSLEDQVAIRSYGSSAYADSIYVRNSIDEVSENQTQGNGITGHDETSEDLFASWNIEDIQKPPTSFLNIITNYCVHNVINNQESCIDAGLVWLDFGFCINDDFPIHSNYFQDQEACEDNLDFTWKAQYDCSEQSQQACPLGNVDCSIVNPMGVIVDYFDVTPYGGPHAITIEDENGYRIELTIWPNEWNIANDPNYSMLLDPPFNRFLVQAYGNVFEYDGEKQISVCGTDDFQIVESYDMDGIFEGFDDIDEDGQFNSYEPYDDSNGNGQWDSAYCEDPKWQDEASCNLNGLNWNAGFCINEDYQDLASCENETDFEPYEDSNGNGQWDSGFCEDDAFLNPESCEYAGWNWYPEELYEDLNENGLWDLYNFIWYPEEPYEDLNDNDIWDAVYEEMYHFNKAKISPSPYVLIASENERLDYSYSFPSNSRVIIRVFDISGRFITTLADKHYPSSGIVRREEDKSSWNGKNHMGQVLPPGTYLMHIEASNFQTGKTTIDVAPVVIGVKNK